VQRISKSELFASANRFRTDARLVNSGDEKWAFSGDFREVPIDLSGVDFIK
jgi:hypothetical protein